MGRPIGVDTITVQRAPLITTAYGDQVRDWSGVLVQTAVNGCDVQPGASQEYLLHRDNSVVAWTVWAPYGTDVTEFDRVLYNGRVYEIDGHPAAWKSPSGRLNHLELVLKDWSG